MAVVKRYKCRVCKTIATRDVAPFSLTVGNRAHLFGVNVVGLRRRRFPAEAIAALRQAYRLLGEPGVTVSEALRRIEAEGPHTDEVRTVVELFARQAEDHSCTLAPARRAFHHREA